VSSVWNRVAARTRRLFTEGLGTPVEAGFYDELEERLLAGDVGPQLAASITAGVRAQSPSTLEHAQAVLAAQVTMAMHPGSRALRLEARPATLLFYGINGAGKTTTVGKLAHRLKTQGLRPLVVAADTYRAAGIEQVLAWAERAGVESFAGKPGGDPAAAVFDALQMAQSRGHDAVLVDTAGRLQTQHNLLQELAKIARVAARAQEGAPHESLLVLDAALGQSSLAQAQGFAAALPLTGLVLAKLDGSARGGAVLAVESALGVPVKLAGVGEGLDDLIEFDPQAFAGALFAAA
jgi:fused signal recognition particle receptor